MFQSYNRIAVQATSSRHRRQEHDPRRAGRSGARPL